MISEDVKIFVMITGVILVDLMTWNWNYSLILLLALWITVLFECEENE